MAAKRRSKRLKGSPVVISFILIILAACACIYFFGDKIGIDIFNKNDGGNPTAPVIDGEEAYFHFIDVGQGDAILIMTSEGNMLVDSGDLDGDSQNALKTYLEQQDIKDFKYVVFTHPDSDHIGSADYVINNFNVENVIMPDFSKTTQVYKRMIAAIESKEVNLILIGEDDEICERSGYTFNLGSMLNTVMAPTEYFTDANEMSVVVKSSFGEIDVLLTGDAESKSEKAMLAKYKNGELDCEILKVGHHGSSSSTTAAFLAAVSPDIAVISCGKGNEYGHPHKSTLSKLEGANISVYRTDLVGTVVIKTDGKTVEIVE